MFASCGFPNTLHIVEMASTQMMEEKKHLRLKVTPKEYSQFQITDPPTVTEILELKYSEWHGLLQVSRHQRESVDTYQMES